MPPTGLLSGIGQTLSPELIQFELIPQLTGHPASPPLSGPAQLELIQSHLHSIVAGVLGQGSIRRIQRQLPGLPQHRIEHLGRPGPTGLLAIIDLSQIQQVSLHPAAPSFDLLGNAPIAMIFAVLEPDRKSTRLNSSHSQISYAVFCLKKKKKHYSYY